MVRIRSDFGVKTIVIDPGHGGSESGACANGYIEKDLNLQTSLLLKKELEKYGFKVLMTRETDKELSLKQRGDLAKQNKADFFISVHFNAYNSTAKGFEVIHSYNSEHSSKIAKLIFEEVAKLGLYRRGVWTKKSGHGDYNWYGVLRSSFPIPAIIVEGLFLTNAEDIKNLKDPMFLEKLAKAYAIGICRYFDINITEKSELEKALDILSTKQINGDTITNSPQYWIKAIKEKNINPEYVKLFMIKTAKYLEKI
jgi:N-acetylmuramoyl-L-alanine amidase